METSEHILLIDEHFKPVLQEQSCIEIRNIINSFIQFYEENQDKPAEYWLQKKLSEYLPDSSKEDIEKISKEIIRTLEVDEQKQKSLSEARKNGRSKESWFASDVKASLSLKSQQETVQYISELDNAVKKANEQLYRTITTQSGTVSRNPNLDGFIAEQYHAQTFNLNAQTAGSPYRAKVLEPSPSGYAENSVDIVIVDGNNDIARKYQSKYCKTPAATEKAFELGDYRGQRKLVPYGQEAEITKKTSYVIESPDGIKSRPLSKEQAMRMRDNAQQGNPIKLNYNEFETKGLLGDIAKQTATAGLRGAAIGAGIDIACKICQGKDIKASDVVKTALQTGADFGTKTAVAGALKVSTEKGLISLPKGTPVATCANIAFVAVENLKVLGQMAEGKITPLECLDKMAQTTVATTAGIVASVKGTSLGAAIGSVLGPIGTAAGSFCGSVVGYIAGNKLGQAIAEGIKKVACKAKDIAVSFVKTAASAVTSIATSAWNGLISLFS